MEPNTITIGGKRYKFVWKNCGKDNVGHCDDPSTPGKEIRLRPSLKKYPYALLKILLHELLHASDFTKDERWVDKTANDMARTLIKFGYTRGD